MVITFTCPNCGEVTLTDERFVGQSGPCRRCDAIVTVPKLRSSEVFGTDSTLRMEDDADSRPWPSRTVALAILIGLGSLLFWCLLPTVGSHGTSKRVITQNGLKQIVLALQNYDREYGRLPRVFYRDAQGEIVLPWRVAILPYVEEEPLYERYAKSEPWNSPTNYAVTAAKVDAYGHPDRTDNRDSQTGFVAVTGPGSLFVEGQDKRLTDGKLPPDEMIVLVEVPESDIHWSEPVDVDLFVQFFRARDAHPEERRFLWREGAEVAFADGSIRHLSTKELEKRLQAMFSSARPEDVAARFAALEE